MSAPDICDTLLGLADMDIEVTNKAKLSHKFDLTTIQYNESDLDFLLRFLAKAGISFYFEHSAATHKLVLLDDSSHFPEVSTLRYDRSGSFATAIYYAVQTKGQEGQRAMPYNTGQGGQRVRTRWRAQAAGQPLMLGIALQSLGGGSRGARGRELGRWMQ